MTCRALFLQLCCFLMMTQEAYACKWMGGNIVTLGSAFSIPLLIALLPAFAALIYASIATLEKMRVFKKKLRKASKLLLSFSAGILVCIVLHNAFIIYKPVYTEADNPCTRDGDLKR